MSASTQEGVPSDALFARALAVMPGGNTRTTVFVPPHPPYARRAAGCRLEDEDGRIVIDALNNYTALIHGHAHPAVTAAARAALADGASFGLPTRHEIALAERLAERVPVGESWRFANSGTEAVMMALRIARAATGRDRVLRFTGCYHGTYDAVVAPGSPGVPGGVARDVVEVPVGELEPALRALDEHADDLACVLLDAMPNRAGLRPAPREFVLALRAETSRRGVLLVHDEVLTFRLAYGGLHSLYGFEPDIVTLGKVIGGGLPVGAVGGRRAVMSAFDPRSDVAVGHGGTFSANPVTMRAGIAALDAYDRDEIDRINELGNGLRGRLAEQGWDVTGDGSLLRLHVGEPESLWWRAYEAGVLIAVNGLLCISTAMDATVVAEIGDVFERLRGELRSAG